MPTDEVDLTAMQPDQARAQLAEADTRGRLARTDAPVGARFTGLLGVLVAAILVLVTLLRGSAVGVGVSMACYAAVLGGLIGWQQKRFRVAPRGWRRRYAWGFGLTMALYTGGIFWESLAFPGWALFAPYYVLVAVPSLIAAVLMTRRSVPRRSTDTPGPRTER